MEPRPKVILVHFKISAGYKVSWAPR